MAAGARFLWVGRLKEPFFRDAAAHYLTRLKPLLAWEETVAKDAPGKLPPAEKSAREAKALLDALGPKDFVVCLDERGSELSSRELAGKLRQWTEDPNSKPCFVVGGAYGLTDELRARARFLWSLGRMTLPHELARVVLLEQVYRAATIIKGLPYHHD